MDRTKTLSRYLELYARVYRETRDRIVTRLTFVYGSETAEEAVDGAALELLEDENQYQNHSEGHLRAIFWQRSNSRAIDLERREQRLLEKLKLIAKELAHEQQSDEVDSDNLCHVRFVARFTTVWLVEICEAAWLNAMESTLVRGHWIELKEPAVIAKENGWIDKTLRGVKSRLKPKLSVRLRDSILKLGPTPLIRLLAVDDVFELHPKVLWEMALAITQGNKEG